jgi:hypothetical protein
VVDRIIANPIINSPYCAPERHFAFDIDGITNEIVAGRRRSSYFVPVPRPRKRGQQLELELPELTADQIRLNEPGQASPRGRQKWPRCAARPSWSALPTGPASVRHVRRAAFWERPLLPVPLDDLAVGVTPTRRGVACHDEPTTTGSQRGTPGRGGMSAPG